MVANAKFFLFPLPTLAAENGGLGGRGERVPLRLMERCSSPNGNTALNLLRGFYCQNGEVIFSPFKPQRTRRHLGKALRTIVCTVRHLMSFGRFPE